MTNDTIGLSKSIFTTLKAGSLEKAAFCVGAKAHDASDRIIYDEKGGKLLYDVDGTGAKAAVQVATLSKGLAKLGYHDFLIF